MQLNTKKKQEQYIAEKLFLEKKSFMDKLLSRLFKFSEKIAASDCLTKSQINKLLNKFSEVKEKGNLFEVKAIFDYIDKQRDKDQLGKSWARQVADGRNYAQALKDEFNEFKAEFKADLASYLEEESMKEQIEIYWENNKERFEFKLLEKFLRAFFRVELYAKEYYQEFIEEGELKWEQI